MTWVGSAFADSHLVGLRPGEVVVDGATLRGLEGVQPLRPVDEVRAGWAAAVVCRGFGPVPATVGERAARGTRPAATPRARRAPATAPNPQPQPSQPTLDPLRHHSGQMRQQHRKMHRSHGAPPCTVDRRSAGSATITKSGGASDRWFRLLVWAPDVRDLGAPLVDQRISCSRVVRPGFWLSRGRSEDGSGSDLRMLTAGLVGLPGPAC